MAKEKRSPLDEDAILTLAERAVCDSIGWNDTKLSKERERITKYYNGELPLRQNEGRSSYVSLDVYAGVEMMKAQLLETFSGNPDNLISFPPLGDEDLEGCRIATEYCSYQFWRLNPGFAICRDVIHDALTARIGVVKVYWKKQHQDFEEDIPQATLQDVQAVAALDEVVELEAEEIEEGSGVFTGKLTRRVDTSQVCVDNVPPEEFLISKGATSIEGALVTTHRTRKRRSELIEEGYDKDKVKQINWHNTSELDLSGEYLARTSSYSDGTYPSGDSLQEETQEVTLYETYMKLDRKNGRGVRLYKICHAGRVLLDIEEVDRRPFKAYVALPVPHILYGNNYASRIVPTQNARTVLTRAILDHAAITTNPRWGVVKGGLMNPKEMLENRLGGLVHMTRPDAIKPLEQHNLNPFVFQTIEMLKDSNEETTSISALSQGLNKDAISTQNSEGLVDNLVSLSGQRQKIMARAFADFLVEVYLEVYRLVLENADRDDIVEVAGNFVPVRVSDWVERKTCKVALHLGYGERDRYAAKLKTNASVLSSPPFAPMFQEQNRFDMAMDMLRADGLEGASKYISTPDKIKPPQPDPLAVKELEIKDKQAEAARLTAQANAEKTKVQAQSDMQSMMLEQVKMAIDKAFAERDAARKDFDSATRAEIAHRELDILEAQPQETVTAVASPNS